jgi:hypothetical protein
MQSILVLYVNFVFLCSVVDYVHDKKLKNENEIVSLKAMEKLKLQLAEAEAALEARKKPPPDTGPRVVGEGLVIDEWVWIISLI